MNYQVVYDASQTGIDWPVIVMATGLLAVAIILWKDRGSGTGQVSPWFAAIVLIFALIFSPCVIIGKVNEYITAQTRLHANQTAVVEGRVENFNPGVYPNVLESFTVNGVRFEYSEFARTPGFHHTSIYGGPMKAGLQVRIHYTNLAGQTVKPTILRLEIAK